MATAKTRKRFINERAVFVVLTLAPMLILYILFHVVPRFTAFYYPFTDYNGINPPNWIGLENIKTLLFKDPDFWPTIANNLRFWVITTPINFFAALIVAYLLTKKSYPEGNFYRILFYFPAVLPGVLTALIWQFSFHGGFGIVNTVLNALGFNIGEFYWLAYPNTARLVVMTFMIWSGWASHMLIFMGAIQAVPQSLYESAELDGATDSVKLFKITLPIIWETAKTIIFFGIVGMFGLFEPILIMTKGGPSRATDVVAHYMYNLTFGNGLFGYGSAIGLFIFAVLLIVSIIAFKFMDRGEAVEMAG